MSFTADRFFACITLGPPVHLELTLAVPDPNMAATYKKNIDTLIDMTPRMPADKREVLEPILSALNIRQDGNEVHCDATWQTKDVGGSNPAGARN
jgi:hypothetical protein